LATVWAHHRRVAEHAVHAQAAAALERGRGLDELLVDGLARRDAELLGHLGHLGPGPEAGLLAVEPLGRLHLGRREQILGSGLRLGRRGCLRGEALALGAGALAGCAPALALHHHARGRAAMRDVHARVIAAATRAPIASRVSGCIRGRAGRSGRLALHGAGARRQLLGQGGLARSAAGIAGALALLRLLLAVPDVAIHLGSPRVWWQRGGAADSVGPTHAAWARWTLYGTPAHILPPHTPSLL
jgi:hypothetical protein